MDILKTIFVFSVTFVKSKLLFLAHLVPARSVVMVLDHTEQEEQGVKMPEAHTEDALHRGENSSEKNTIVIIVRDSVWR